MKGSLTQAGALLWLLILGGSSVACRQASALAGELDIPTATVKQADLQLKILTTGALRSKESRVIAAPPIAGGTLQIVKLARFGAQVHKDEVVLEFDPSQQEYNLAQNRSDLLQAEQEIAKAKADAAVQTAEDQTALLKAKYAVRQAELEVSKNELVSKIDGQKNILALDEAKRALAQLEQDIHSHSASNKAALEISEEKRHKARLAMDQAEENIKKMRIIAPIDGLVVIHGNRDATGGWFFDGMTLPDYHVGDQVNPGSSIAEVIDVSHLELYAQVGESDHTNLKPGQPVDIQVYALPSEHFTGKVETVGGATSHEFWDDNSQHKFDVTVLLDKPDPRLRPGFAARLSIRGDQLSHAVSIPSEAVFEREGKKIVYCKQHGSFDAQQVKIRALSEGRAVVEGIRPGTVVALVNPEARALEKAKASNAEPASGPSVK
ncbi:MAG TPA: efflux RND transporter periplasmic adaptor subunit [Candidatus Acidoferrum sp.]|jgi:HlyD family secretion protein|nr:efflux RND transporter periplasmic adaptor subunit [Candidatus Acidoferrum sp.]